jgi:hypothetical protein
MDFIDKVEWDKMTQEMGETDFILDLDKMRIESCLKNNWAEEMNKFFSDVEISGHVKTLNYEMPKRNFWQRLKYLFTGK